MQLEGPTGKLVQYLLILEVACQILPQPLPTHTHATTGSHPSIPWLGKRGSVERRGANYSASSSFSKPERKRWKS